MCEVSRNNSVFVLATAFLLLQSAFAGNLSPEESRVIGDARATIDTVRKGTVTLRVTDGFGTPVANTPITVALTRHAFLFGCNIFGFDDFETENENALYKQRFEDVFNYATTGFYWASYEPVQGRPNYAKTDKIVAWCVERGIEVKGHPLLWDHEAAEPAWANGQPDIKAQQKRVRAIVGRYKGKIEFWEVVNEPSHVDGVPIDGPYRWAREADPNAHLIINDYEVMATGCPPFFAMLQSAVKNAIPFDGIGIQAHELRTMRFPLDRVKATLDKYATLGKAIHITEFTPTSAGAHMTGASASGVWNEQTQAEYAEQFYTVCFAHPAVVAITWWDLCDAKSWLKGGGLLRGDLSPKPAYETLRRLIKEEWHTHVSGTTNEHGEFQFTGFYGAYAVETDRGAARITTEVYLGKNTPSLLQISLK